MVTWPGRLLGADDPAYFSRSAVALGLAVRVAAVHSGPEETLLSHDGPELLRTQR